MSNPIVAPSLNLVINLTSLVKMQVSSFFIGLLAVAFAGVGFTLLTYSRDGDLKLRSQTLDPTLNREEAWQRLSALANAQSTEVTWNTSLFVALASALVLLSLANLARTLPDSPTNTSLLFFVALFTVFGLQDGVIRWKAAHRKNAAAQEQLNLIERLKWKDI